MCDDGECKNIHVTEKQQRADSTSYKYPDGRGSAPGSCFLLPEEWVPMSGRWRGASGRRRNDHLQTDLCLALHKCYCVFTKPFP
jgi:hypothetical protein